MNISRNQSAIEQFADYEHHLFLFRAQPYLKTIDANNRFLGVSGFLIC